MALFTSYLFGPGSAEDPSAEEKAGPQDKAKIIPESIVMDFVEMNTFCKYGYNKSDGCDQSLPYSFPETGDLPLIIRRFFKVIGARRTADRN